MLAFLGLLVLVPPVLADETTRISNSPSGKSGNNPSFDCAISADGSTVVFRSLASDLVSGDTSGSSDIFVFDRTTAVLSMASVDSNGDQADADSYSPDVSGDGRLVVFASKATNLDSTRPNGPYYDIFLRDRTAGTTRIVTRDKDGLETNGDSGSPVISDDGGRIVFTSIASDLVPNDTGSQQDVFVYDIASDTIALVSADQNGNHGVGFSGYPHVSGDGGFVEFVSYASNFPGATSGAAMYVKDLETGVIGRVDVDSSGTAIGRLWLSTVGLSDDGSRALFATSFDVKPDDQDGLWDAYVHDRVTGTTERVSLATGHQEIGGHVLEAALSGDGRHVIFVAADFLDEDTNQRADYFVRDLDHDITQRISVGTLDEQGSDESRPSAGFANSISSNGGVIAFQSVATEFAPDEYDLWDVDYPDIFVRARSLAAATAVHYDSGFPGRNGVIPTVTPAAPPWRRSTLDLEIENSSGLYTVGFVFLGLSRASVSTRLGGTLVVDPLLVLPIAINKYGEHLTGAVPWNWWADGLVIDLQVLELDPYAAEGVSFTDGLELTLGDG
jgi:Tol biopolymer transport system component